MNEQKNSILLAAFILPLLICGGVSAQSLPEDHEQRMKLGTEMFRQSIRGILTDHCLKCHGGEKVRGDFDLSSRASLIESGHVDLKDPESSYLLTLIRHEDEPSMPPSGEKLGEALIADVSRWIALGAPFDKPLIEKKEAATEMQVTENDRQFWSFRELSSPNPPADESGWARTDMDRFIWAKLNENGLQPNPPAGDLARIRRAYLDVIGLPPTPEQIDEALEISHETLVDQLLESPHYGERWARHWLDAARFAESHGFEQDYDRKYAYHYRDFVIKALNSDMAWDQFVRWQIAGDEIAPDDPLAMMATGFLGAGVFPTQLTEKEFESARYDELDDMAATIGTAMLGLTIGCARCHDHKFDPIPASDYYRFVSTFTTTIRSEVDVPLDPDGDQARHARWNAKHNELVAARDAFRQDPQVVDEFERWLREGARAEIPQSDWSILDVTDATSSRPSTVLKVQPDGAVLASGNPPTKETYTVKAGTGGEPIRFIRIEALTHPSMKRQGPGRAGNGNFALSHLKLFAISPENDPQRGSDAASQRTQIKLVSARATHQQNEDNLSVASAIDQDPSGTGWAVDRGGIGKDQAAVFELESPFGLDGENVDQETLLEFQLTFSNNAQHSLGRFRLSVSSASDPPVAVEDATGRLPNDVLAAMESGTLKPEHRETLFPIFAAKHPRWKQLNDAVESSLAGKPEPSLATVQVSSEGFAPTKHHADGRGFPHFYPKTYFLNRGDPNQKKGVAPSGYLQVLMRGGKSSADWQQEPPPEWTRTSYRRTGLANWISDTKYGAGHLLARVIVNRIWHHHFGRGIVATPNDFGLQGSPPSHPALLDFLAKRLIDGGWKIKSLHLEILTSATWLQSTQSSQKNSAIDPENQWLWRFPNRRLEAEVVRDAMLAASGQLDTTMFGPGTLDESHRRRSVYFKIKRSRLVPMMQIFDQPEPLSSQGSRPSTTIAPQALLFMNNTQVVRWSSALAESVGHQRIEDAITNIYRRALGRKPNQTELEQNRSFVEQQAVSYQRGSDREEAESRRLALADLCQVVFGLNEFIYLP